MFRMYRFFITVLQVILLFDITQQSRVKQAMTTVKTIASNIKSPFMKTLGNTMKNPVGMLRRNKSIMKNIAYSFKEKQLSPNNNFGSKHIKYLGKEAIKKFKSTTPQAFRAGNQLVRAQGKKDIYMRSAAQMSGKEIKYMIKRSAQFMRGKELSSLINMVSKSKPQLPFLAGGSLMSMTQLSLAPTCHLHEDEPYQEFEVGETPYPPPDNTPKIDYEAKMRMDLESGAVYRGDIVNRKMHGQGRLTFPNEDGAKDVENTGKGDVYEGNFVDNEMQGIGKITYKNGHLYEGEFLNTKAHGKGKYTIDDEDMYAGEFVDGKIQGKGVYKKAPGNVYEGDHVDGKYEGKGKIIYHGGNVYTGEWKNGDRNGYGEYICTDGNYYKGYWADNLYSSEGKYEQKIGEEIFKGEEFYKDKTKDDWFEEQFPGRDKDGYVIEKKKD